MGPTPRSETKANALPGSVLSGHLEGRARQDVRDKVRASCEFGSQIGVGDLRPDSPWLQYCGS